MHNQNIKDNLELIRKIQELNPEVTILLDSKIVNGNNHLSFYSSVPLTELKYPENYHIDFLNGTITDFSNLKPSYMSIKVNDISLAKSIKTHNISEIKESGYTDDEELRIAGQKEREEKNKAFIEELDARQKLLSDTFGDKMPESIEREFKTITRIKNLLDEGVHPRAWKPELTELGVYVDGHSKLVFKSEIDTLYKLQKENEEIIAKGKVEEKETKVEEPEVKEETTPKAEENKEEKKKKNKIVDDQYSAIIKRRGTRKITKGKKQLSVKIYGLIDRIKDKLPFKKKKEETVTVTPTPEVTPAAPTPTPEVAPEVITPAPTPELPPRKNQTIIKANETKAELEKIYNDKKAKLMGGLDEYEKMLIEDLIAENIPIDVNEFEQMLGERTVDHDKVKACYSAILEEKKKIEPSIKELDAAIKREYIAKDLNDKIADLYNNLGDLEKMFVDDATAEWIQPADSEFYMMLNSRTVDKEQILTYLEKVQNLKLNSAYNVLTDDEKKLVTEVRKGNLKVGENKFLDLMKKYSANPHRVLNYYRELAETTKQKGKIDQMLGRKPIIDTSKLDEFEKIAVEDAKAENLTPKDNEFDQMMSERTVNKDKVMSEINKHLEELKKLDEQGKEITEKIQNLGGRSK